MSDNIDLMKMQEQLNAITALLSRGGVPLKIKKRGRPKTKKADEPEVISAQHLKILEAIASAEPFPADWLAKTALAAGYTKGNGASAMFRGRKPSLAYEVQKTIVLTERGKELLEQGRKNKPRALEAASKAEILQNTNGDAKEVQPTV